MRYTYIYVCLYTPHIYMNYQEQYPEHSKCSINIGVNYNDVINFFLLSYGTD